MGEIPQPSPEPYSEGEKVRIYLGPDDPDDRFHGWVCEVIDVYRDDLNIETERSLDSYSYTLRKIEDGEKLPIPFRHRDLVPVSDK